MADKILIIEATIGYMLKVLKSQVQLTKYKKEFAAIRHGNYYEFINLIGEPIPFMIMYHSGVICEETEAKRNDIDFAGLYKAGPSLKVFYQNCQDYYGQMKDPDFEDSVFREVALFEISLRMHAKNNNLLNERENFVDVIAKLCKYKNLSERETETLQGGRQFLNMIKHSSKKFNSWSEGLIEFEKAYKIIKEYQLTVV